MSIQLSHTASTSLQYLSFHSLHVPYNREITKFVCRFSQLSHLAFDSLRFDSFGDLHRIICAFPSLLDLSPSQGDTVSQSIAHHNGPRFTPRDHPHRRKVSLTQMGQKIMVPFSRWIASMYVCSTCADLTIRINSDASDGYVTWIRPILGHFGDTLESFRCSHYGQLLNICT